MILSTKRIIHSKMNIKLRYINKSKTINANDYNNVNPNANKSNQNMMNS